MFLCLAAAPSVDFIPPTGQSSAGARVGVICRAKRVRTAGWGRAGCSRRRDSRGTEGRRWDRNRARAHLRVVDVQSTNGASVRAAAASKAAGLRLRRVRYFARLPDRGRGARTAAAPAWRPSWASTAAPAGGCFSVSRPILVIFARFFFCVLALWSFSTMLTSALTPTLHGRRQSRVRSTPRQSLSGRRRQR